MALHYFLEAKKYYLYVFIIIAVLVAATLFLMAKRIYEEPTVVVLAPMVNFSGDKLSPGIIGELEGANTSTENSFVANFPEAIFNTSGKITDITDQTLVVEGSGSNFEDQQPRRLVVVFNSSTVVLRLGDNEKLYGFDGLNHLERGMNVLIQGQENIRGKIKFVAGYVYIPRN